MFGNERKLFSGSAAKRERLKKRQAATIIHLAAPGFGKSKQKKGALMRALTAFVQKNIQKAIWDRNLFLS